MSTRVLWALPAGAALAATALAVPAYAAGSPYTHAPAQCTVTPGSTKTGSTVSIVGVGFTAGSTVGVKGTGSAVVVSTSGKADKNGSLTVSGKAGSPGKGTYTLSSGTQSATCSVTVEPAVVATSVAPVPSPSVEANVLPRTGASGIPMALGIGGALLVAGAGAVVLSARRKV